MPALTFDDLFAVIPEIWRLHGPNTNTYKTIARLARATVESSPFRNTANARAKFGGFGEIEFPYHKMGAIDSLNLFDLDELILFAFYWSARDVYRTTVDIGANIGLHSLLMAKCGWTVHAYEPDPTHLALWQRNVTLNALARASVTNAAVCDVTGTREFIRVLGNTTGSHLAGEKAPPYGELERFSVNVKAFRPLVESVDFAKVDAEGAEKAMILTTTADSWRHLDMMVEIGSRESAEAVFAHLGRLGVSVFAQKQGWSLVRRLEDMPMNYRDGSLFVTAKGVGPWDLVSRTKPG